MSGSPFFLFGAATSSHQVEGQNQFNDWWHWEQAGRLKEPSGTACDQIHKYQEDIQIISDLGHNAHRFSIEWSRLEPSRGQWNEEGFQYYENFFRALKAQNIEPVVTLNHFTLPQWFAERGGWEKSENLEDFQNYVQKVVGRFGSYVRYWVTINEPMVYVFYGYHEGIWPPGKKDFGLALQVIRNLLLAHTQAYKNIHDIYEREDLGPAFVSIAKNMIWFTPHSETSMEDSLACYFRDWFFNRLCLNALDSGFLFFPTLFAEFLPAKKTMDFMGLNYYFRERIKFSGLSGTDLMGQKIEMNEGEKNQLGWEVAPKGLYHLLLSLKRYDLPVLVLENGICTLEDSQRARFIRTHLAQIEEARRKDVPVNGYFHWSLLDNFEWAEGFEPRFGITEVDFQTLSRKVRPSAQVLTDQCRKILDKP